MGWLRTLVLFSALAFVAAPAMADTRVALVIGNSCYAGAGTLPNPRGDAALVAEILKSEGFDVTLVQDATRSAMLRALNAFNDAADQADWALIYYAGHGMEVGGTNYLLPTDVHLQSDRDAQDEAISLDRVQEAVANARKLRLVILDACRNNPFTSTMKRSIALRSVERGLAPPNPAAGIIVVYSVEAGGVAEDGTGEHSPFTAALAVRLKQPGLEVSHLFNVVAADVLRATGKRQRPFLYGSNPSEEEFYFEPPAPPPPPGPSPYEQMWSHLKGSADVKTLEAFRDSLPADSRLLGAVEARLAELRRETVQMAAITPALLGDPVRDAAVAECDRLAASPHDQDRPSKVKGVPFEQIDTRAAVKACRVAVQNDPNNRRLHLELGRALAADKTYDEAMAEFEKAAAAGNADGMFTLGALYDQGHGVRQDYAAARNWYEKAAAAGSADAMYNLGFNYDRGEDGVPQDYAAARSWYEKAAAAGNAEAMAGLGNLYHDGQGVRQDYATARSWYEKGAAAGNAIAQNNLGVMYENGEGVRRDYAAARSRFEKAAAGGSADAMSNLGVMYENGDGVRQDYAAARSWFEKAAAAGDKDAQAQLAKLKPKRR